LFSSTEASARNEPWLAVGKTNVGFFTGVPPSCLIAAVSAATCCSSSAPNASGVCLRLTAEADLPALTS